MREAVFNSIIHKVYFSNIPIQIKITNDAMYISNDCYLPGNWTKETLLNHHRSIPYNPNIAKTFYRCGYVETWGRGIQKIHESCKEQGLPIPQYTVYPAYIEVKFEVQTKMLNNKILNKLLLTWDEQKIVNEIEKNPFVTQKELAQIIGISKTTVNKYLKSLIDKQIINKDKINSKTIQYSINYLKYKLDQN